MVGHTALAQHPIHLDVQLGLKHNYAEETYRLRRQLPQPLRYGIGDRSPMPNLVGAQVRVGLNPRWSVAAGVLAGDIVGWGYRLRVPAEATHNPYVPEDKGEYYGTFALAVPLTAYRSVWRLNTTGLGARGQTHAWGLGADVSAGLTPSYATGGLDFPRLNLPGLYDTITFDQAPRFRRRFGMSLTLGATLRLYRLDRERLNLSLQLNQGLWDMVQVPFSYAYNRRGGSARLHARGSGLLLTLGYPIRLRRDEQ